MTKQTFQAEWTSAFPEAYPIGHELRKIYPNRWFRIHSLPDSKRYAETEAEYQIIYQRQNEIIGEVLGENGIVAWSFGLYTFRDETTENNSVITGLGEFTKVNTFSLHDIKPSEYAEDEHFDIYAKWGTWKSNQYNEILRAKADDRLRIMMISFAKKRIIIPYDGGLDVICESTTVRDDYRLKYHSWLSKYPTGL